MLTIMGIAARDRGIDISSANATVIKEMTKVGPRRISKLRVEISLPAALGEKSRNLMERAAQGCPVMGSLSPDVEIDLSFTYS
jgi:uncharacterized OsmC-like protein